MVQINFAQKQVNAKIVYYGPGMSGKTTNLEIVYQRAPQPNRGELTSISTDGDRTLFFDFMPLDLGTVAGMRTCFQIYTVPGQVYYNSTRKLVLQGVDGVVFVADSSTAMKDENIEDMRNLEQNLNEYGKSLGTIPLVLQYNKRDLPDAMSVAELNALLNPHNVPYFEAIANTGQGVFPTLKALAARVLDTIHTGAKTGGAANAVASIAPSAPIPAVAAGAPMPTSQTGFHAAPATGQPAAAAAGHPAVRPLQQTGYTAAAQLSGVRPGASTMPGVPQGGVPTQAHGSVDPMARTTVHPPPGLHPTAPAGSISMSGGKGPSAPLSIAQPTQGAAAAPAGASGLRMASTTQLENAKPQAGGAGQGGALHLMRNDPGAAAIAPGAGAQKRPANTARPAPRAESARPAPRAEPARAAPRAEPAGRLQPRAQALPTPVPGSRKKSAVYTVLFIVVALGVGAVVARLAMSFF
jgi:signal recognition particle receptor subunit beta